MIEAEARQTVAKEFASPAPVPAPALANGAASSPSDESQKGDSPVPSALPVLSEVGGRSHCVLVHHVEGQSVDKWTELLTRPDLYELVSGLRGAVAPDKKVTTSYPPFVLSWMWCN